MPRHYAAYTNMTAIFDFILFTSSMRVMRYYFGNFRESKSKRLFCIYCDLLFLFDLLEYIFENIAIKVSCKKNNYTFTILRKLKKYKKCKNYYQLASALEL